MLDRTSGKNIPFLRCISWLLGALICHARSYKLRLLISENGEETAHLSKTTVGKSEVSAQVKQIHKMVLVEGAFFC